MCGLGSAPSITSSSLACSTPHPPSPCTLWIPSPLRSYDFGTGAGFYLDATEDKWRQYRMYSYITAELPALLRTLPRLDVDNVGGELGGGEGGGA